VLTPAGVVTFNPYGSPPGNTENAVKVQGAIDNNPSTAWTTEVYYDRPNFGGLQRGAGLLINMGKAVKLSQVQVTFASTGGPTTASVYLGNNPTDTTATALSNFTLVSPSVAASGDHTFSVSSQATGQYVLIWLTSLPQVSNPPDVAPGHTYYQGQVYNVVVRGSAASGNS
jgi:putative peptidoglycan lipid II flippase